MITLTTYLLMDGNCKPAMEFYKAVFGGKLTLTMVAETVMKDFMPQSMHEKIINARLVGEGIDISASDWLRPAEKAIQGNMICLYFWLKKRFDKNPGKENDSCTAISS